MNKIITRFAPSPTGMLHVGNARTALVNWLYARKHNGKFILRIDDTDLARSKDEYKKAILEDLSWLGLTWDEIFSQSQRYEIYNQVKESLIKDGRLYECFETQEELETKRKLQLSSGRPPIYDRASLKLSKEQKERYISQGRKPHYRFMLKDERISWHDLIKGEVNFESQNLSDPILIREDGSMTYMLCSTIDDIDFKISHVIRGEDHITNTALQIQIFAALKATSPSFGHLALITSKEEKISKRIGGFDLAALRNEFNIEPMAINSLLSCLGSSISVTACKLMQEILNNFDISKYSRNPANYSFDDLERLNHKILSITEFAEIKNNIDDELNNKITEDFWLAIRGNIKNISEVKLWWQIVHFPAKVNVDENFKKVAQEMLPKGEMNKDSWSIWTSAISEKTSLKGRELFMPLRLLLTGMEQGPELKNLLPIIGREEILKRIS